MDNTSGDNKNRFVFGMLAALVRYGLFKEVEVIHLLVGHTHNDVDAVFGVLARRIRHATFHTVDQQIQGLMNCITKSKYSLILKLF